MTTAMMPRELTAVAAPTITPEQMALITKTVAKDATPDELKLYLYDCARQGVHPLDKLIHFTKRGGKYTPVTSIDFMRIQAANSGECLGISDPVFEMDGPKLAAATVTVKRFVQGMVAEFTATARWSEYFPGEQSGHMWKKMPHTMLGKCAEALALRKGFPKQLAGLYAREEMDQAESRSEPIVKAPRPVEAPNPEHIDAQAEAVAVRPPAPAGYLYIEECAKGTHAKKAGEVTFSNGEIATVWARDGQLFDLAMELCQEGKPVKATLQPGKGDYGPTLKGLARMDAEHDQRREPSGDWTQDIPAPDQPF